MLFSKLWKKNWSENKKFCNSKFWENWVLWEVFFRRTTVKKIFSELFHRKLLNFLTSKFFYLFSESDISATNSRITKINQQFHFSNFTFFNFHSHGNYFHSNFPSNSSQTEKKKWSLKKFSHRQFFSKKTVSFSTATDTFFKITLHSSKLISPQFSSFWISLNRTFSELSSPDKHSQIFHQISDTCPKIGNISKTITPTKKCHQTRMKVYKTSFSTRLPNFKKSYPNPLKSLITVLELWNFVSEILKTE